jgi:hypothetical protein
VKPHEHMTGHKMDAPVAHPPDGRQAGDEITQINDRDGDYPNDQPPQPYPMQPPAF